MNKENLLQTTNPFKAYFIFILTGGIYIFYLLSFGYLSVPFIQHNLNNLIKLHEKNRSKENLSFPKLS